MRAALIAGATLVAGGAVAAPAGCASSIAPDPGLEGLALTGVAPDVIVPGTRIAVSGASFVDAEWGAATLVVAGDAGGRAVELRWPAAFVDFHSLSVAVGADDLAQLGGDADLRGRARIEVVSAVDGETYASRELPVALAFRERLGPDGVAIAATGLAFVNDRIEVAGAGFLLGGDEGTTVARVAGCFTRDGAGECRPVGELELAMTPVDPLARDRATFALSPRIAGIQPGTFTGRITVVNQQAGAPPAAAAAVEVRFELIAPQIFAVDPPAASLGQYVFVHGGGFVGGEPGALTELELAGTFERAGGAQAPVAMTLIPELVEGRLVRYVVNTDDALGRALDLRRDTGEFAGTITPVVSYGADLVRGVAIRTRFALAPVKQVVQLQFQPSYIEGLRDFGLRAVHAHIRERVVEVCRRAYAGVNLELRDQPPAEFALFARVELLGVDPNDQGLFGYDNSPGKDSGNLRLYDRLGGVNAATQQDGFPGFGGVFVRSLLGFSQHPGELARPVPGADPMFDAIFDPFRPDRGGAPVSSSDLAAGIPRISDGSQCPGSDRPTRIGCAIFVLGNLVGGTLAHEIGHSLGLANPYGDGFHSPGDAPNRLMDAGGDRPFLERAELAGQGPAVFCDDEFAYLRTILPSPAAPPAVARPSCR